MWCQWPPGKAARGTEFNNISPAAGSNQAFPRFHEGLRNNPKTTRPIDVAGDIARLHGSSSDHDWTLATLASWALSHGPKSDIVTQRLRSWLPPW